MRVWFERIAQSKSKTFLAFCFFFLAGVAGAFLLPLPVAGVYWYALVILLLAALIFFWPARNASRSDAGRHEKSARLWIGCLLFLVLGIWRVSFAGFDCDSPTRVCFYSGRTVQVTGYVAGFPQETVSNIVYTISVEKISNANTPVNGKMLVRWPRYPKFNYGDAVALNCRLEQPQPKAGETFQYGRYLAAHGIQALCQFPTDLAALPDQPDFRLGQSILQKIFAIKTALYNKAARLWGEPESSFIIGLLFGGATSLPPDIKEAFQRTGLSHVLAVSGFNVAIIATALMSLLILIGFWRQPAYWVTLLVLISFVVMTGATASVVRAAIMGALVLTAEYLGRLSRLGTALAVTAAAMVLANPYVLLYDAGFQLSFLATLGLVYLSPVFKKIFPNKTPPVLVATLAAITMTLPLMLYQFGLVSVVAPLVNVLLLWSVPFLMLGGFAALAGGVLFLPLGAILALPAAIAGKIFLFIVQWFAVWPYAAINFSIPWWLMLFLYGLILYLVIGEWYNREQTRL